MKVSSSLRKIMKRLPAKSLNESSVYVSCQRDKREHCFVEKKDPNDPRTLEEIKELPWKERFEATTYRSFQTEAWIRGEEYPMPGKINMPEEDDIICEELMKGFDV